MAKQFLEYPFTLSQDVYEQLIASIPAQYRVYNPWSWKSTSDRAILSSPSKVAIDMDGEGVVLNGSLDIDLSDSANWDTGLSTDYTVAANRGGMWFFIVAVYDGTNLSFLITDDGTTLNTVVLKYRVIEKFYCYNSSLENYLGQVTAGVSEGDIDVRSFSSVSGETVQVLFSDTEPDISAPYVFYFNTTTTGLYFNTGSSWKIISEESTIKDFDFMVGSTVPYMGTIVPTGLISLETSTNKLVSRTAYPKLFAAYGETYAAGDGSTTFGLPSVDQVATKEWAPPLYENLSYASQTLTQVVENGFYRVRLADSTGSSVYVQLMKVEDQINLFYFSWGNTGQLSYNASTGVWDTGDATLFVQRIEQALVPENIIWCVVSGNGSLSVVQDTAIDTRLTDLENTLAAVEPPYSTDWILLNDVTNRLFTINHNLNAWLPDLEVHFYVSSDGTDNNAIEIEYITIRDAQASFHGYHYASTSLNSIEIQTGSGELLYFNTSGTTTAVPTTWYYKVTVTKKAFAPLIQSNYAPFKDWVNFYKDLSNTSLPLSLYAPDGEYEVITSDDTDSIKRGELRIDRVNFPSQRYFFGLISDVSGTGEVYYDTTTDTWILDDTSLYIRIINRKEDTVGQNRESNPLRDGWERVTDIPATTVTVTKTGRYGCLIDYAGTSGNLMYGEIYISDLSKTTYTTVYTDVSTGEDLTITYSSNQLSIDQAGYASARFWIVDYFTGLLSFNVSNITRTITGTPQVYTFKIDPSGNTTLSSSTSWVPLDGSSNNEFPDITNGLIQNGDRLVFHHSGLIVDNYYIEGLPQSEVIYPTDTIEFIADKDNGEWAILNKNKRTVRAEYYNQVTVLADTPLNYNSSTGGEDTHSAVTTGSAWKFTAPYAGIAKVSGCFGPAAASANVSIHKNDTLYKIIGVAPSTQVLNFTTSIKLDKGDYIHIEYSAAVTAHSTDNISIELE